MDTIIVLVCYTIGIGITIPIVIKYGDDPDGFAPMLSILFWPIAWAIGVGVLVGKIITKKLPDL